MWMVNLTGMEPNLLPLKDIKNSNNVQVVEYDVMAG
jgi:hypothetical protein